MNWGLKGELNGVPLASVADSTLQVTNVANAKKSRRNQPLVLTKPYALTCPAE